MEWGIDVKSTQSSDFVIAGYSHKLYKQQIQGNKNQTYFTFKVFLHLLKDYLKVTVF